MKTKIIYIVKYPKISTLIEKREVSSSLWVTHNRSEIYAGTWEEAYDFLLTEATNQVKELNEKLSVAIDHLHKVQLLKKPSP